MRFGVSNKSTISWGCMPTRGKFIVIDGMDGSGKGTQIKMLKERLVDTPVIFSREPGGSPLGEEIREILLRREGPKSNPISDFFLFFASRGSHIEETVEPARTKGIHVISDRYDSSTYAFQIFGEERQELKALYEAVRSNLDPKKFHPDLYIFLDLPGEVAYERRKNDNAQAKSKFDILPLEYHERTREGFREFVKKYGPAELVDANRSPEVIHENMWKIISREFNL
jgi:dTMP kinase